VNKVFSHAPKQTVVEALQAVLSSDLYPLHSRLPAERQLCELLKVSRSALRNGLDKLERDGRIWRHVGKGTFVGGRPQSVQSCAEALGNDTTLSELLEARMLTEPQVARLAALRAEPSDIDLMQHYDRAAARAGDWTSWDQWDELFHRAIVEAGGNGLMINAMDQILRIKKRTPWTITRAQTFDPGLRNRYAAEHRAVIEAIAAHDPKRAEDAMALHIRGISSSIGPATARTGSCRA
jgi:DNA-binding FadR family transcriptional regulator